MTPTDKARFHTYATALPHSETWTKGKAEELTAILRNKLVIEALGRVLLENTSFEKAWSGLNLADAVQLNKAIKLQGMAGGMARFVDALLELTEEESYERPPSDTDSD